MSHVDYDALSHADRRVYNRAITFTHERKIHVRLETLDGAPVGSLRPKILDGSIAIDVTSEVSHRVLTLKFLDPLRVVAFEPGHPYGSNAHRKFQIVVVDARHIEALGLWVDVTVHTGPLWDFTRTGAEVSITAHGRDRLCRGTVRVPRAWRKKSVKTTIIKTLLRAAGMTVMQIPDLPARTGKTVTIGFSYRHHKKHVKGKKGTKGHDVTVTNQVPRTDHYLDPAEHLADSMNQHLYWTGAGVPTLRPHPERPVLRLERHVLSDPTLTRPGVDVTNTWKVTGKKPKGHHRKVKAKVALPPGNDLSAQSLAVNSKPYTVEEKIDAPHANRTVECARIGRRHRDRAAKLTAELEADVLPVPWLQEYDMVTLPTLHGEATILMTQWTYPLGPDSTAMHIGSTVKPRPRHGHSRGVGIS